MKTADLLKDEERGFTLVEMLIYIAIFAVAISSFVFLGVTISESRNESYVVQEVQANNRMALDIISQKIRQATSVNIGSSTFGSDPGVLSLAMAEAGSDPTLINLDQDDGTLRITEGASSPVNVTSKQVTVKSLIFTNLTDGERENIKIEMTVEYKNSGDVEYIYSQSVQTAVSVRQ